MSPSIAPCEADDRQPASAPTAAIAVGRRLWPRGRGPTRGPSRFVLALVAAVIGIADLQRPHDGPGAHASSRHGHVGRGSDGARVDGCHPARPVRRRRPDAGTRGVDLVPRRRGLVWRRRAVPAADLGGPREQRGDRVPGPRRGRDERDRRRAARRSPAGGRAAAGPWSAHRGLLGAGRGPGQSRLRGRRHQPEWLRPGGVPGWPRGRPDRTRWHRSSTPERHPRLVRRGRSDRGRVGGRCRLRRPDAGCQRASDRRPRLRQHGVRRPLDGRSGLLRGLPPGHAVRGSGGSRRHPVDRCPADRPDGTEPRSSSTVPLGSAMGSARPPTRTSRPSRTRGARSGSPSRAASTWTSGTWACCEGPSTRPSRWVPSMPGG